MLIAATDQLARTRPDLHLAIAGGGRDAGRLRRRAAGTQTTLLGRVADDEMDGTFNMGLGMILVVDREELPDGAKVVGEVVSQTGPDRVVIR